MKRIVKLVAVDPRYKGTPYPHRCIYDESINTYLTGQHIDPRDPDTFDNLTVEEMTGKTRLSPDKAKRFPYVINPEHRINFTNGKKYDLTKDKSGNYISPMDAAMYNLLKKHTWYVALAKESVRPSKDYFYLHDEIAEAERRVKNSEETFQAEKYVRELSKEGVFDLALVLQYKISSFKFNEHEYSEIVLKDMVISTCKTNPSVILECKKPSFKDDIFVLKLALHGIIKRKGTDFYDGSEFLGGNLEDIKKEINKETRTSQVSKWNRELARIENRIPESTTDQSKKKEVYDEIKDYDVDELKKYAGSKRYSKTDWGHLEKKEELVQFLISKVN